MTFRLATIDGRAALVDAQLRRCADLEHLSGGRLQSDPMAALGVVDDLHTLAALLATGDGLAGEHPATFDELLADGRVGPPVPRPVNCFGVGLNYHDHAAESAMEPPASPLVFTKFPTCIVGPRADIELCADRADWEVELVVVIGPGGRSIPAERAWSHVVGLTVGQDISDRALQFASSPPHFDLGKSRDTYGPTGPVLVSTDAFDDPADLAITCDIDGERMQDSRTSGLIFDIPTLIAFLSSILTLRTGDLVFTGTPAGVGAGQGRFLRPGTEITSTIEGIGTLVNRCLPGPHSGF